MGSGDFLQSTEAEDVMSDTSCGGRWLHFNLSGGGDSLVILDDGDRKAPQHLKNLDIHNKVRVELNNTHCAKVSLGISNATKKHEHHKSNRC